MQDLQVKKEAFQHAIGGRCRTWWIWSYHSSCCWHAATNTQLSGSNSNTGTQSYHLEASSVQAITSFLLGFQGTERSSSGRWIILKLSSYQHGKLSTVKLSSYQFMELSSYHIQRKTSAHMCEGVHEDDFASGNSNRRKQFENMEMSKNPKKRPHWALRLAGFEFLLDAENGQCMQYQIEGTRFWTETFRPMCLARKVTVTCSNLSGP